MSPDEMLRFNRSEMEQHADSYCKREAALANDLVELLRVASFLAPLGSASRVRQLMIDADRLERFFSAMYDALYDAGERVDKT